ncbi:MAG: RNA polymerase sigma factor, partial [Saprospiraceae bacterium]|nr:RNA polymerase sigma factor [Saprospiraceae bacterium]
MVHSAEKSELFVSVIEAHKGILFKITNSYCKNAEDRKDLLQEIIIQLWKSFDRYDSHFKFSTWIYRIALNVSITYFRKANRRRQVYG